MGYFKANYLRTITLSADSVVVPTDGVATIMLGSDSATSTSRTFTLETSSQVGHVLTLIFTSGSSYTCQLADSGTMKLQNGDWVPLQYDTLQLISDGTNWLEVSRSVGGGLPESMLTAPDTVGLGVKRTAYAVFDPSAVSGDRTIAAHALGTAIPINSFVTGFWYWVETTCTSATDAATIAIKIEGANDCVSAIAISDVSNPWDTTAKPVEGITKVETTSTWLATTAARQITATVAVEALTAGKVHIWAEYVAY